MPTVTLKHVADHVGVDRSTVSRVLRDRGDEVGISRALTERIKAAAALLNYAPNASARAVRSGRFGAAALLMSTVAGRSYLPSPLLDGIHDELARDDMHLTIAKVRDEQLDRDGAVPKALREYLADGLLINYTHHIPPHLLRAVESLKRPVVWINADLPHDAVNAANRAAARLATERLIGLGHRRVAYLDLCAGVAEVAGAHHSARDRRDGYRDAMRDAGLTAREWRPATVPEPGRAEAAFVLEALSRRPRPTAVLCYFSINLPPLLRAAASLDLVVPRDLSVVSFAPQLWHDAGVDVDCMVEPHEAMGREAVRMLRQRIAAPGRRLASRTLDFEFRPLGTTAAPSGKVS